MAQEVLAIGSSGQDVETLQQILIEQGFECGEDTQSDPRVFGPETESAVKFFQASHDGPDGKCLVVDGVAGPATWWALENPSGSAQGVPSTVLSDMPAQEASNPIAVAALHSAWTELRKNVHEIPDGSNRSPEIDIYTGMVGEPVSAVGPPWCAYFVSFNMKTASGGSPFGKIGGAQTIAHYCQKNIPKSVLVPPSANLVKPGDIGIIADGQIHGHAVHIAATQDDYVWTVEGNSGNAVRTKKRLIGSFCYFVNFDDYAKSKGLL